MNNIEKLFLIDNLTGREISKITGKSKSSIYEELKELGSTEIKNSLLYRFWSKVEIEDSCWNFTGALSKGYGRIKEEGKLELAHRFSHEFFNGKIKEGLFVCHKCDNPKCVNPDHLFLGTHSDNMKDAYNKDRLNIPKGRKFKNGHLPKNSKMSLKKAKIIKNAIFSRKERKESLKDISKRFNINYQIIRDMSAGRSYINI